MRSPARSPAPREPVHVTAQKQAAQTPEAADISSDAVSLPQAETTQSSADGNISSEFSHWQTKSWVSQPISAAALTMQGTFGFMSVPLSKERLGAWYSYSAGGNGRCGSAAGGRPCVGGHVGSRQISGEKNEGSPHVVSDHSFCLGCRAFMSRGWKAFWVSNKITSGTERS